MGKQISYAAVGVARQVFQVCADLAAQAGDFLRQHDAELGDQAAQAVVACGAFLDESLPGAVQTQDDLLVFFLDRDEKHGRASDGLADRGGIRRIVLAETASHAIGRDELRCHQFDGVAVTAAPSGARRSRLPCRSGTAAVARSAAAGQRVKLSV